MNTFLCDDREVKQLFYTACCVTFEVFCSLGPLITPLACIEVDAECWRGPVSIHLFAGSNTCLSNSMLCSIMFARSLAVAQVLDHAPSSIYFLCYVMMYSALSFMRFINCYSSHHGQISNAKVLSSHNSE